MFYFLSPFPFINLTIPSTGWRFELSCVICMYKVFGWLYHDSPEYNVRKMWSSFFHLFRVGREWTSSKKMFSTGSFFSLPSHLVEGGWLLDLNGCKCLSLQGPDWTILNFVSVSNDCFFVKLYLGRTCTCTEFCWCIRTHGLNELNWKSIFDSSASTTLWAAGVVSVKQV